MIDELFIHEFINTKNMENQENNSTETFLQYATKGFLNKLMIFGTTLAAIGGLFIPFIGIDTGFDGDIGDIIGISVFSLIVCAIYFFSFKRLLSITLILSLTLSTIFFAWKGWSTIFLISLPIFFWSLSKQTFDKDPKNRKP